MYEFDEDQYLAICKELLDEVQQHGGFSTDDRTGVGTAKLFARMMRFDLSEGFPLFTHKQVFMRGVFEELMFFLRGQTDNNILKDKNVHIWDEWEDKLHLQNPKLFAKGELGNIYSHAWRNFGGWREDIDGDDIKGFDQISWLINEVKTNPNSRRLLVSAWNPHDHCVDGRAALPPCHTLFQLFVKDGALSCQLYQRSADFLLGVPFNVASYALLTHMIAQVCGLEVGEFVWVGGDIHVYSNQLEALKEVVCNRHSLTPPQILLNPNVRNIFDFEWGDVALMDYSNLGKIEIPVAV